MSLEQLQAFSAVTPEGKLISLKEIMDRLKASVEATESKLADTGRQAPQKVAGIDKLQLIAWTEKVTPHSYANKGKPGTFETTDYKVRLFKAFSKYEPPLKINPKAGRLDGNTLALNIQLKRFKTDAELAAWEKRCDEKNLAKDHKDRQQKFVYENGGEFFLTSGQSVTFKVKGKPKLTPGGSPITEKMLVFVQGIQVTQDMTREQKKVGETYVPWDPSLEASNIAVCDSDEDINTAMLIREAALGSMLCDLSQANGYGSVDEEDRAVDEAQPVGEADVGALGEWKSRMANVPPTERPLVTAPFSLDFRLDELNTPSVGTLLSPRSFYIRSIACPGGDKLVIKKDGDPVSRTCELQLECQVMEGGDPAHARYSHPTKLAFVKLSPRTYKENDTSHVLLEYGIVNLHAWMNLAPELVPKTDALIEAKVNLGDTVSQTTNTLMTNPIDPETGLPKTGYHFAVCYYIQALIPDLVSGVLRVGRQINLRAAKALLRKNNGKSDDLGKFLPQALQGDVDLCPLNKSADKKVLNLFLHPASVETLQATHQFYLVLAGASTEWEDMANKMRKNGDDTLDGWSMILSGACRSCEKYYCTDKHNINPKSYKKFPTVTKDADPYTYVVFAVSNSAVEEFRARRPPSDEEREAAFRKIITDAQANGQSAALKKQHEVPAADEDDDAVLPEAKKQRVEEEEENKDLSEDIGL